MLPPVSDRRNRRRLARAWAGLERAVFLADGDPTVRAAAVREHAATIDDIESNARTREVLALVDDPSADRRTAYRDRHGVAGVRRFTSSEGDRIYQMRAETFPGHVNWVYFVAGQTPSGEDIALLWDVGSGVSTTNEEIEEDLDVVHRVFAEKNARFDRLTQIVISHAHIDHFGGAVYFTEKAPQAPLAVHELDARVLEAFEERLVVASKDLGVFMKRSGLARDRIDELEAMHRLSKELFRSVRVERRLRHRQRIANRYEVIHTPGHCPGHICLRVGDHLLVADQVLDPITPNIPPQSITPFTGLENYINGLVRLRAVDGIAIALPAHAEVITDLGGRIDAILEHHRARLEKVYEGASSPMTIAEIAELLYGERDGYDVLLAITEAGAHVEYLNEMGRLSIANLDEVQAERDPVIRYQRRRT